MARWRGAHRSAHLWAGARRKTKIATSTNPAAVGKMTSPGGSLRRWRRATGRRGSRQCPATEAGSHCVEAQRFAAGLAGSARAQGQCRRGQNGTLIQKIQRQLMASTM